VALALADIYIGKFNFVNVLRLTHVGIEDLKKKGRLRWGGFAEKGRKE